jgi:hypothetical protein
MVALTHSKYEASFRAARVSKLFETETETSPLPHTCHQVMRQNLGAFRQALCRG